MNNNNIIKISVNRKRFPFLLIISFFLTIGGAYNITRIRYEGEEQISHWAYVVLLLPGFFCIISFLEFLKTRFDKNATLIISETGINDNLSIFSCGKIIWNDITYVDITRSYNTDILIIRVLDNGKYLRNKNFIKQLILKRLISKWGSPIIISAKRVDYNLNDLKQLILEYRQSKIVK